MKWWSRLWHRSRMEEQLDKELRFHLDQHTSDLIAQGCHPDEARRQARLAIGGQEQVKEGCRDARGTRWLEDLAQDIRYAARGLARRPGFTAVALLTLALGSGATTIMFTLINGVLLKPLPYPHPEKLLRVDEQTKGVVDYRWGDRWAFAYPNFLDCRRESRSVDLAAWRYSGGTISDSSEPEYVDGLQISADLLPVVGVTLLRGRAFQVEEDRPGAAPVIIIGYGLWQRRFAGNPNAIGMPMVFEGKPHTIVGITPPGFRLRDAEVFTPLGQNTLGVMRNRDAHPGINVWARLRPGATLLDAQSELEVLGHRLAAEYPKSNTGRGFIAEPLRPDVADVRSTLWLLLGAVTLVLLIACTNVASLLLARAVSRERELAMRVALGAGRARLIRQCLTESAVLGICGGAVGILLAAVGIRPFVMFWPGSLPRAEEVHVDWHVLLFALGISLVSGLLFGLAPALRAPTLGLHKPLRSGGRGEAGGRRLHSGFVISEIALAMVLLVCAGMLARTMLRLSSLDPGIDIHNMLTARMALSPGVLSSPERIRTAWQDVLEHARRVPGVDSVALVDTIPMRQGDNQLGYWQGPAEPPRNRKPLALATSVTPDYARVAGLPLRRGRFFKEHDRTGSEPVIVIDEVMAQHAFPGEDPIGKRLGTDMGPDPVRIVGVVSHVRHWGLAGDDQAVVRDQFYYPFAQVPDRLLRRWSELMSIAVRTRVTPAGVVEPLRREVRGAMGDQVVYEIHSMEELARSSLARQRFLLLLFGMFAGLALLLASAGIYGVMAYVTSRRVAEIGVRMALGARPGEVVRLVLRQSLGMIGGGVLVGFGGALAAGHALARLVAGTTPVDLWTFGVMIAILVGAALCASFVPASRASRIDPASALRQE